jgi:hypothetical protein
LQKSKHSFFGLFFKVYLTLLIPYFFVSFSAGSPRDVVVVYDASAEGALYHYDMQDYAATSLLNEFLRRGDTFHLVSFSKEASLELTRKITSVSDYKTVVARLFLLLPMERESDADAAINWTKNYIQLLPQGREKDVVFLSAKNGLAEKMAASFDTPNVRGYLAGFPLAGGGPKSDRIVPRRDAPAQKTPPVPIPATSAPAAPAPVLAEPEPPASPATVPFEYPDISLPFMESPLENILQTHVEPLFYERQLPFFILPLALALIALAITLPLFLTTEKRNMESVAGDFLYRNQWASIESGLESRSGLLAHAQSLRENML